MAKFKDDYVCICGSSNVIDHNGVKECLDCGYIE